MAEADSSTSDPTPSTSKQAAGLHQAVEDEALTEHGNCRLHRGIELPPTQDAQLIHVDLDFARIPLPCRILISGEIRLEALMQLRCYSRFSPLI